MPKEKYTTKEQRNAAKRKKIAKLEKFKTAIKKRASQVKKSVKKTPILQLPAPGANIKKFTHRGTVEGGGRSTPPPVPRTPKTFNTTKGAAGGGAGIRKYVHTGTVEGTRGATPPPVPKTPKTFNTTKVGATAMAANKSITGQAQKLITDAKMKGQKLLTNMKKNLPVKYRAAKSAVKGAASRVTKAPTAKVAAGFLGRSAGLNLPTAGAVVGAGAAGYGAGYALNKYAIDPLLWDKTGGKGSSTKLPLSPLEAAQRVQGLAGRKKGAFTKQPKKTTPVTKRKGVKKYGSRAGTNIAPLKSASKDIFNPNKIKTTKMAPVDTSKYSSDPQVKQGWSGWQVGAVAGVAGLGGALLGSYMARGRKQQPSTVIHGNVYKRKYYYR